MRRLAFAAAVCGTLVLSACNDQTPTEPAVPAPSENFGSCGATPFPLAGANGIAAQIANIYPGTSKAQTLLRATALAQAAAIKLFWDTCHPAAARLAAFSFIDWLNRHTPAGKETQVQNLILAVLRGIGEVTGAPADGDFGVGFFDPANTNNTVITTVNHHALVELEPGSFLVPTEIVIARKAGDPPLTNFTGNQYPPTYDYNAINSTNTHVLQPGKTAVVAFCLLALDDVAFPGGYAENLRIGHNPVAGAPGFPFEILDPVDLVAEGLRDDLDCPGQPFTTGSAFGGLENIANAALRTAGSFLLPQPLWAAALGTIPPPPPLGGKAGSLSPFRPVEAPSNTIINFDVGPDGDTQVADGAVVNTLYAPLGITFQHAGTGATCGSTNVYANSDPPGEWGTFPNAVSLCGLNIASDISENTFGLIRADLATAAEQVCINVLPDNVDDFARIDAFNAVGALIESSSSSPGVTGVLCVSASGIRRVEFSGAGDTFARFDDLEVDYTAPIILLQ
jgi:hypothetical protein